MFVLSIINLRGALAKDDLMVTGLREVTFIAALSDLVIIEEFVYKMILEGANIPYLHYLNDYFPLLSAVFMLTIPLFMFHRYMKYDV